jgi:hypothetical protein
MALNPAFDDFAEPFLSRMLAWARRRSLRENGDWRGWLGSFLAGTDDTGIDGGPIDAAALSEEIDLLETELRFRRLLGIEKKP